MRGPLHFPWARRRLPVLDHSSPLQAPFLAWSFAAAGCLSPPAGRVFRMRVGGGLASGGASRLAAEDEPPAAFGAVCGDSLAHGTSVGVMRLARTALTDCSRTRMRCSVTGTASSSPRWIIRYTVCRDTLSALATWVTGMRFSVQMESSVTSAVYRVLILRWGWLGMFPVVGLELGQPPGADTPRVAPLVATKPFGESGAALPSADTVGLRAPVGGH